MKLVGFHLASDISMLVRNGFRLPDGLEIVDAEVMAKWLYPDQESNDLEHLTLRMTNMGVWRPNFKKLNGEDFDAMSDEALRHRCGNDAEAALRLARILEPEIHKQGLSKIWKLAMDVLPILGEIGGTGMGLNREELRKRVKYLGGDKDLDIPGWLSLEVQKLQSDLEIENLRSDQQLSKALFEKFGAEPLEKTTKGYSVGKKSLMWARYQAQARKQLELVALLSRILEFNIADKLYSTYYHPWYKSGGLRVHSIYSLSATSTGRMASYMYNLQNLPDVTRELVIPSEGFDYILQADFKMLELVVAAQLSRDPVMSDWIARGLDIHSITSARVLGLPEPQTQEDFRHFKEKYPDQRASGKLSNFAVLFGIEADSLVWKIFEDTKGKILISEEEAQAHIETFNETFAGFVDYTYELATLLDNGEPITSPVGRIWYLPASTAGLRKAKNYPIQSTASDITVLVLRDIVHILRKEGWKSRPIGEVHDSVVFETTKKELMGLANLVKRVFENPNTQKEFGFKMHVPLRIELAFGESWGTLKVLDI